ncbi:non-ribosomal peptide synthetase [Nonomuraea zeae]|uniref:Amino acid adenylation domain-containing protein n=1 Tax=Nonomuraea zeae TaxID=1642303 RepID=A0A5S4G7M7_9ACTN|nr:non-ribosomal peptide synthetase [Nonomuraea zeae]TMR21950.1 amino acid adenylation domain-containing protein [Nonomuraea zeae]
MNSNEFRALSPIQHGLLFHAVQDGGAYLDQVLLTLRARPEPRAFRRAWRTAFEQHEMLTMSFDWTSEATARQRPRPGAELPIDVLDPPVGDIDAWLAGEREKGFELTGAPLVRAVFARSASGEPLLLLQYSNLIMDFRSLKKVLNAVARLYAGGDAGPATTRTYREYVDWWEQRGPAGDEDVTFWRELLSGHEPPSLSAIAGARTTATGSPPVPGLLETPAADTSAHLDRIAAACGISRETALQGAWHLLLGRYTGSRDVVLGSTDVHRPLGAAYDAIGPMTLTLPVRQHIRPEASVAGWLRGYQETRDESWRHASLPLPEIQRLCPGIGGNELIQSAVVFEELRPAELAPELGITGIRYESRPHFPLTVIARDGEEFRLRLVYRPGVFDATMMRQLLAHLRAMVAEMAADPARPVGSIDVLSERERAQILRWGRGPAIRTPAPTIHEAISRALARSPERVAVLDGTGEITRAELESRSNQLARHLMDQGVRPGGAVGVLVKRSRELPVILLAIMKCGAAFVPFDGGFPDQRLQLMTADAGIELVVSDSAHWGRFAGVRVVYVDRDREAVSAHGTSAPGVPVQGTDLAYLIYTSGSTGRPKGVEVMHRGTLALLRDLGERIGLGEGTTWAAGANAACDLCVVDLFMPLLFGGRVTVLPDDVVVDGVRLGEELTRREATHHQATPSGWRLLMEAGWRAPGSLTGVVGGEALSGDLADDLARAGVRPLWNVYGPTEASVWATIEEVGAARPVPIGRRVGDADLYVLDDLGRPSPVGVPGELCIGGIALARGYRNLPERTRERFRDHPLAADPPGRLYWTGDRARWLPEGKLEFLGRDDGQVKVRGYRIELGEIEAVLRLCPGVNDVAVLVSENEARQRSLTACVVGDAGPAPDPGELRRFLQDRLAPYMVPDRYLHLDAMPLTHNAKRDLRALAALGAAAERAGDAQPPQTPLERQVAQLVEDVLHVRGVGRLEDLGRYGLRSLESMRVAARISRTWPVSVTVHSILSNPTIADVSSAVQSAMK